MADFEINIFMKLFKILLYVLVISLVGVLGTYLVYNIPDYAVTGHFPVCAKNDTDFVIGKTWSESVGILSTTTRYYVVINDKPEQIDRDIFARIEPGQVVNATTTTCESVVWGTKTSTKIHW